MHNETLVKNELVASEAGAVGALTEPRESPKFSVATSQNVMERHVPSIRPGSRRGTFTDWRSAEKCASWRHDAAELGTQNESTSNSTSHPPKTLISSRFAPSEVSEVLRHRRAIANLKFDLDTLPQARSASKWCRASRAQLRHIIVTWRNSNG